jgi:hypothetical protein
MGYNYAAGVAEMTGDLRTAVSVHLTYNCYPAMTEFTDAGVEAIRAVLDEDEDHLVPMPKGVSHKVYGDQVPAGKLIGMLHLDAIVDWAYYDQEVM